MEVEKCVICQESTKEKLSKVGKGLQKLILYSETFDLVELINHLKWIKCQREENEEQAFSVHVHQSCQKKVSNVLRDRQIDGSSSAKLPKLSTRLSVDTFNWRKHCLFCGKLCLFDEKHPDRNKPTRGEKKPYRDSVLERCRERDDVEAREIERRVLSCSDFIAAEARYHESCRNRFNLSCQKTMMSPGTRGRPVNSAQQQH